MWPQWLPEHSQHCAYLFCSFLFIISDMSILLEVWETETHTHMEPVASDFMFPRPHHVLEDRRLRPCGWGWVGGGAKPSFLEW